MDTTQSSQGFVRALKGQADPPQPGGLSKIGIAQKAWDNEEFYVPNKGEVISDWIMTRLLKDKAKEPPANPVADLRYWSLLADVIAPLNKPRVISTARPNKTWLGPILNRVPIAPIIIALLKLYPSIAEGPRSAVSEAARRCLAALWPMGVHKLSSDTLLECLGAVLRSYQWCELDKNLATIGQLVLVSFRSGLANASNKKKLYTTFMQTHLADWLNCASLTLSGSALSESLLDIIYNAGADLIYNLDTLRAIHDTKSEHPLFQTLTNTAQATPTVVLRVVPRLFGSYVDHLKRARVALFSQSSNTTTAASTEDVRTSSMAFFACCEALLAGVSETDQVWSTRVELLALVDSENLLAARQPEAEHVLLEMVEVSIKVLDSGYKEENVAKTRMAINVLSAITRINYDLVVSAIPRILPKMLLVLQPNASSFTLLNLLIDYHTKTRTMNTYISSLIVAFSPQNIPPGREFYRITSSGPLLSPIHLDRLSKSTRGFLTAGQTIETVDVVLQALKESWEAIAEAEPIDEGTRKKRKLEDGASAATGSTGMNTFAVSFSLTAKLSSIVLPSLPIKSVPQDTTEELRSLIKNGHNSVIHGALKHTSKNLRKKGDDDLWALEIATAALLKFQYLLNAARSLGLTIKRDEKIAAKLLELVVSEKEVLPELAVEIFRALLAYSTESELIEPVLVLDAVLAYLEASFCASGVSWSGFSCVLVAGERGKQEAALALLYMILERWLPVIDICATSQQLERLLRLIMAININETFAATQTELVPGLFLIQILRSAGFWELPNIRNVFLAELVSKTSLLDEDIPTKPKKMQKLQAAIATYELLLFVPPEYLSRPARAEFVRRALAADRLASVLPGGKDACVFTAVRVFLDRVFSLSGSVDHTQIPEFLERLVESLNDDSSQGSSEYTNVTLDLIESHTHALLKLSTPESVESSVKIIRSLHGPNSRPLSLAVRRVMQVLTRDFSATQLPGEVTQEIRFVLDHQTTTLQPIMAQIAASGNLTSSGPSVLSAWCSTLALKRWLVETGLEVVVEFGRPLLTRLLSSGNSADVSELAPPTFSVLLEELLGSAEATHAMNLEICIAAYVALYRLSTESGKDEMDKFMSKACKLLSVADFSRILALLSESMTGIDQSTGELATVVHLSDLVLREAPQGTLKPIQSFTTECFNLFASRNVFTAGPMDVRLHVLEFTARHSSERPAALRLLDISSIWSLLSRFLAPSQTHDGETCPEIFAQVSSITSALVRLRRDLVSLTLPHLGMVLRQLFLSVRNVRPLLGAKHNKLVMDTLPLWVSMPQPLGPPEGKILARLLGTLTTKSVVRTHATVTEAVKAESLTKPFAKHAAYVLKAYIEAMNDPLCMLPSELRKELEPGLFALCDMLSEHSRDAMMMSALDTGGKTTLKSLWKEYEKQRYVGKG